MRNAVLLFHAGFGRSPSSMSCFGEFDAQEARNRISLEVLLFQQQSMTFQKLRPAADFHGGVGVFQWGIPRPPGNEGDGNTG